MNKIFFIFLLFNFKAANAQPNAEQKVLQVLQLQEQAWNQGDINGFMNGYWNSDSLLFVSKNGITYGWQKTLLNYKKAYPDTASMGTLQFDILEIKRLSVLYFYVIGKWQLKRNSLPNIGGHFTLLFKRIKNKWVIVTDHTS